MDNDKRAGQCIKQVLTERGISQNRLATAMGASRSTVNQWYNGVSDPQGDSIPQIAQGLELIDDPPFSWSVSLVYY